MRIRWRNFELPSRVVAEPASRTETYAKFVVEPFERGFGHTVGNGLRRVLLSSIEGFAITHIKIEDVQHEFSTIEGMLEDVVDVVLNVKGILVRLNGDGPVPLRLDVTRSGEVTAGDIVCPAEAEILNPEHVICTLTTERSFRMELEARKGRAYQTAEENEAALFEEKEVGVITIDSNFSPVVRVRYKCEDTRVGKITNYDKLIIEVWTDGSVHPEAALVEAAKIYRKHLNPFIHYLQPAGAVLAGEEEILSADILQLEDEAPVDSAQDPSISTLDLSVRARNCLDSENIRSLGQLLQLSETDLLELRNFGQTSLKEVRAKLAENGLALKGATVLDVDGDDDGGVN